MRARVVNTGTRMVHGGAGVVYMGTGMVAHLISLRWRVTHGWWNAHLRVGLPIWCRRRCPVMYHLGRGRPRHGRVYIGGS